MKFYDWGKSRTKKHHNRVHEIRIFELIFSKKLREFELELDGIENVEIYCLANPNKPTSYEVNRVLGEISILIPYDFMNFLNLESTEDKYSEFCELVHQYVIPAIEKTSTLPSSVILKYIEEALKEIEKQNYEGVFLVDKTPKKSPNRKQLAILKGIHRVEGFQLRCEVYNDKGLRIVNQLLVEEVGNEVVYSRFLGTLKWESDDLIVVKSKTSGWIAKVYVK